MKIMKFILSLFIVSLFSTKLSAQKSEPVVGRAFYDFFHIEDTTQRDKPHRENMALILSKSASMYLSKSAVAQQESIEKQIKEQMEASNGTRITLNASGSGKVTRSEIFYFGKENKMYYTERLLSTYLIQEPDFKIDWNITEDTMTIEGMLCTKATGRFRGRNWIAWFAPELPFESGPWKLHGLPGLIVDAHDDKNEVKFSFAGFETVKADAAPAPKAQDETLKIRLFSAGNYNITDLKLPDDAVRTTKKEFEKLKEARDKDPQGFINSQMAGSSSGTIRITGVRAAPSASSANKITLNNPIELSEK